MMLKKSISNSHLLTIFLALVLTISAIEVMPVKADSLPASLNFINYTFTVNSTLDLPDDLTQPGTCHTAANTCTLRAAIMQANRAGFVGSVTIIVPSGHYVLTPPASPADGDESGDLNMTTPTAYTTTYNIVGAGAATTIIDANSYDRVLHVHSGRSVVISGVTIQNGYLVTGINSGCGIYNEGLLNLNDMVITNNHCAGYGGGIYNLNALAVSDSTINLNTSFFGGGGIGESGSFLSIMNSTISGNSSTGSNGGGILSGGTETRISNSTISSNSAYGSGGGIYNSSQNLIIINSTLIANLANFNGGAIFNKSTGQMNVYNSTIAFNGADWDADINGGQAGGVYNAGFFNLRNTLLAGNSVSGAPVYDDCGGTISSYGRNLIGAPYDYTSGSCTVYTGSGTWAQLNDLNLLGNLQDNGGPTKTVALLPGSNAIDGADPVLGCINSSNVVLPADQRGHARVVGASCDIGAFEFAPPTFTDVPIVYWSWHYIESLYSGGITGGCLAAPLNYCPTTAVTRAQMAIFLLRGMHGSAYTPPAATGSMFTDVSAGSFGAAWIEQLATEGITSGCGGGKFCPNTIVTRAQMAVFLVRAKHGIAFVPPAATGIFSDVPVGSFGANYIEQLVTDGVTSGCGGGLYCPSSTVKRDSMAVFLVKTFNLP